MRCTGGCDLLSCSSERLQTATEVRTRTSLVYRIGEIPSRPSVSSIPVIGRWLEELVVKKLSIPSNLKWRTNLKGVRFGTNPVGTSLALEESSSSKCQCQVLRPQAIGIKPCHVGPFVPQLSFIANTNRCRHRYHLIYNYLYEASGVVHSLKVYLLSPPVDKWLAHFQD